MFRFSFVHLAVILGKETEEELPDPINAEIQEGFEAFPWNLQTKYYTCNVLLYVTSVSELPHQYELASGLRFHGVVVVFDEIEVNFHSYCIYWNKCPGCLFNS